MFFFQLGGRTYALAHFAILTRVIKGYYCHLHCLSFTCTYRRVNRESIFVISFAFTIAYIFSCFVLPLTWEILLSSDVYCDSEITWLATEWITCAISSHFHAFLVTLAPIWRSCRSWEEKPTHSTRIQFACHVNSHLNEFLSLLTTKSHTWACSPSSEWNILLTNRHILVYSRNWNAIFTLATLCHLRELYYETHDTYVCLTWEVNISID
jgi:hypothetical protein